MPGIFARKTSPCRHICSLSSCESGRVTAGIHVPVYGSGSLIASPIRQETHMISEHLTNFAGLPARDFDPAKKLNAPAESAWRLSISYEEQEEQKTFCDKLAAFLADPGAKQVQALIIGCWEEAGAGQDSAEIIEALVSGR